MKKTAAEMIKPPFPGKMTFREMMTNLFNTDFLSPEELTMICDAGEMYANGCCELVLAPLRPLAFADHSSVEYNMEEIRKILNEYYGL